MVLVDGGVTAFQFEWFATIWLALCLLVIASLVIFVLVAVWMYRDAEARGMSGGLWVLLLILASIVLPILGGLIVLVIYLILRGERPFLGQPTPYGTYGYGAYGAPPPQPPVPPAAPAAPEPQAAQVACKACGAPLHANAAFCANCGTKV